VLGEAPRCGFTSDADFFLPFGGGGGVVALNALAGGKADPACSGKSAETLPAPTIACAAKD